MANAIQIRPAELIDANESPALIGLFSETLKLAEAAAAGKPRASMLPPGPFWILANRSVGFAEIVRLWEGKIPQGWPPWFERNARIVQDHVLNEPFLQCLSAAPDAGIESSQDVCRVMAAVAQTLFSSNIEIVQRNRAVAGLKLPVSTPVDEWSDEEAFVSRRPDERGGCVAVDRLTAWIASDIGPAYADKIENQDAVYAAPCRDGLAFALADGVSTSFGSRFAAALVAFRFCQTLRNMEQKASIGPAALVEAVRLTQQSMDGELYRLLADSASTRMTTIMETSRTHLRTAHALLENTRTGEKSSLQPALASTLIGGLIQPAKCSGQFTAWVICVGDGVVEKIDSDGEVNRILITDPEVSEIAASLAPGPMARDDVQSGKIAPYSIDVHEGEQLLISSDGLARGHSEATWSKIKEIAGDIRPRLQRDHPDAVVGLLRDLTAHASEQQEGGRLFDDNVSLIIVAAG